VSFGGKPFAGRRSGLTEASYSGTGLTEASYSGTGLTEASYSGTGLAEASYNDETGLGETGYRAATMASPISRVPARRVPSLQISPVRRPSSMTLRTAASMASAAACSLKE
jgi:hypothetical protein